ncbi:MAG TPA: class I SAM-dependent methyltransferase, partial [Vicinamibacterales bacterium]|nr:class I SAM-dependent methyltransferase [Vicinamibacterales bacterium]
MNPATRSAARIVDFFDRRAVDYNHAYGHETTAGYALRVRRKKVLELFDRPGGVVLDVGCGPGIMAEEMLARGCQFYGIDPAETMISIAQERYGGSARFLLGDAARLPFANGFFDAVICTGVVDSLVDGSQAVGEMVRVLKPDGTFIISFANLTSPYAW